MLWQFGPTVSALGLQDRLCIEPTGLRLRHNRQNRPTVWHSPILLSRRPPHLLSSCWLKDRQHAPADQLLNVCKHRNSQCSVFKAIFITPPPIGKRSIVMSVYLCLSVCVCVCPRSYLHNYTSGLHQFFCMLPMAVARSSSCCVVICYVLPVL